MTAQRRMVPVLERPAHALDGDTVRVRRRVNEMEVFASSFPYDSRVCVVTEYWSAVGRIATKFRNSGPSRALHLLMFAEMERHKWLKVDVLPVKCRAAR